MSDNHASARIIDGYAHGAPDLAPDEVWALEAHLEACPVCRESLSAAVTHSVAALTDTVWAALEPHLDRAPVRRRRTARLAHWLTPAMVPWLAMTVGVTLIALLLDVTGTGTGTGPGEVSLVLLLAPVLPVLGVAASWSRGLDPAYDLTASTPRSGLYLVLRRTASVLAVVVPVLFLCGWATGATAAQWLLPCLALTSLTLALGGAVGVTRAAALLAAAWAAVVVAPALAAGRTTAVLGTAGTPLWGTLLAAGAGVVIVRRGAYADSERKTSW
ncbi:zf-HC2 domain-containing protein [Streptomyces sp. 4F14]|uniref:zf-HC2 domain-containing protein n=1 Tax=Streptomyces sp. 4F14 TaxID=3394380 RepID=UPI003A8A59A0